MGAGPPPGRHALGLTGRFRMPSVPQDIELALRHLHGGSTAEALKIFEQLAIAAPADRIHSIDVYHGTKLDQVKVGGVGGHGR